MSEIQVLRIKIDQVTFKMLHLLHERRNMAKKIGKVKKKLDKNLRDEKRESHLRSQVLVLCGEIGLEESSALSLLDFLIEDSLKAQSSAQKT